MAEAKEWIKVTYSPGSGTLVKVTLLDGAASASASVKSHQKGVAASVVEARAMATGFINQIQEAMA